MAKRQQAPKVPAVGLKVTCSSTYTVTRERDPADEWSGESSATSWNEPRVYLTTAHPDLVADFHVAPGQVIFLVRACYSTGDSFSHHESSCHVPVAAFLDFKKAEACRKVIHDHALWAKSIGNLYGSDRKRELKKYPSQDTVDYVSESGKVVTEGTPWTGYFEHLSWVSAVPVMVYPSTDID